MTPDDAIRRTLAYLADRIEGAPTAEQRAALAGIAPDAALDVAAAVFVGMMSSREPVPGPLRPFTAGLLRGMVEVQDMAAWFELEVEP